MRVLPPAGRRPDPTSFDHLPAMFDRYAELVGGPLRTWLTERLPVRGTRAVDLGCGTGIHTRLLADRYPEVYAVDVSAPMIAFAAQYRPAVNLTYAHRDLDDLDPARDGRFDVVLSDYTLHHVPDLDATLRRIRGLTAPGGTVLLVDICDQPVRSRSWFRTQAARQLAADLRQHRRAVAETVEVFRLSTHPDWLDHQVTDRPLPPAEFADRYQTVFPDADITRFYRGRGVHWTAPPEEPSR